MTDSWGHGHRLSHPCNLVLPTQDLVQDKFNNVTRDRQLLPGGSGCGIFFGQNCPHQLFCCKAQAVEVPKFPEESELILIPKRAGIKAGEASKSLALGT